MEEDNKDTDEADDDDDEEEENFPCNLTNGLSLWLEQLTIPPNITKWYLFFLMFVHAQTSSSFQSFLTRFTYGLIFS